MPDVRLRPLTLDDFEPLWAARQADKTFAGRSRPGARQRLRAQLERAPTLERDGWLALGVEVDGRLVGDVQARHPKHAMPAGVYEIGISLFDGERGKGIGRHAVELFTDLLFDAHAAGRIQASTAVDNAAMRRVLGLVGWTFEGVMRGFWPTGDGRRDDYALYAVTRDDWESRKAPINSDT